MNERPLAHLEFTAIPTDAEIAENLRVDARTHLLEIVALQNRAAKHNMQIGFQLARDQFGRNFVQSIDVLKVL